LILTCEEVVPTETIRAQPDRTIIPYYLVDAVVEVPFGSHPGEMPYLYRRDEDHIKDWVAASKEAETAQSYLEEYIYSVEDHQAYLARLGEERLGALRVETEGKSQ
jgi:hypothetical protein